MGMHLFNVKQLFSRRRKYDRVLGGQQEGSLDLVASPPSAHKHHHNTHINKINGQHSQAQENFNGSSAAASSSSSSILWGFKLRPKLRMRKQKSLKFASKTAGTPHPSQAAVQNFLQGPSEAKGEDEVYQQECRDLLRKLSARGNRVPGFI